MPPPAVRALRWPDDAEAVLLHLQRAYAPEDFAILAETYGQMPGFAAENCLVIEGKSGAIAAQVLLIPRQVQIGVSVLPALEVSALSVLEECVDPDCTAALHTALHDRMSAQGAALGLTLSDPAALAGWDYVPALGLYLTAYESEIGLDLALRAGRGMAANGYDRRIAARLGITGQPVTVRRFYASDLPAVQALYAADSARGHYVLARDERAWLWQIDHLARSGRSDPDDFLVAEVGGEVAGYLRLVPHGPVNQFCGGQAASFSIIECAGSQPDAIEALLGECAQLAQTLDVDRLGLFVHPQSALMRHALAHGGCLRAFTGAAHLRLHDLGAALEALAPELDRRRRESCFADQGLALLIATERRQASLQLGAEPLQDVILEASCAALTQLLTGWIGIDAPGLAYDPAHADLLRVLFPQRDPRIGLADVL